MLQCETVEDQSEAMEVILTLWSLLQSEAVELSPITGCRVVSHHLMYSNWPVK